MSRNDNDMHPTGKPEGWDRYAAMLQAYGKDAEVPESLTRRQSVEAFEREFQKRQQQRNIRWGLGLPGGLVAVALIGFGIHASLSDSPIADDPPVVRVAEPPAASREPDQFAAPEIPPVWVDSDFDAIELPPPGILEIDVADSILHVSSMIDTPVAGE